METDRGCLNMSHTRKKFFYLIGLQDSSD